MSNHRENKPGCEQCQEELLTWLEHPLGPREEQTFRERFAHCPDCLRELTEQQTMLSVLQTHLLEAEPSASIDQWILEMAREAVDDVPVQASDSMSWWDRLFALLSTPAFKAGLSFALLTLVVGGSYILVSPNLNTKQTANFSARKLAPKQTVGDVSLPSKRAAAAVKGKDGKLTALKKAKPGGFTNPFAGGVEPRGNLADDSAKKPAMSGKKQPPVPVVVAARPTPRKARAFKPRPRPILRRKARRRRLKNRRGGRRRSRWSRRGRRWKKQKQGQRKVLRRRGKRRAKSRQIDNDALSKAIAQRLRKNSLSGSGKVPNDVRKKRLVARRRRRPWKTSPTKTDKLKDNHQKKNRAAGVNRPTRSAIGTDRPAPKTPKKESQVLKTGRRKNDVGHTLGGSKRARRAVPSPSGGGKGGRTGAVAQKYAKPPRMDSNDTSPPPPPPAAGNSGGGSAMPRRAPPRRQRYRYRPSRRPSAPSMAPSAPKAAPVARYKKKTAMNFNSGSRIRTASKRRDSAEGNKLSSRLNLYNNSRNALDRRESAFLVGRSWLARHNLKKADFWFQRYLALTPSSLKIKALRRIKDAYQLYRRNNEARRLLKQLMKADPLNQRSYQREMRRLR